MNRATRTMEVVRAGPLTTVQDGGRPGHAHLGVPRSGALDRPALAMANELVGNPPTAAALETTVGGVVLRARCRCWAAVTGAVAEVVLDGEPAGWGVAIELADGQVLSVGAARLGLRSYVAIGGGIAVDPVLGSRSTDLLSGLGPPQLRAGEVLPLGSSRRPPETRRVVTPDESARPLVLRLVLGPREDWITPGAIGILTSATYSVSPMSNRIALRLDGPILARARDDELASEGVVLGAVQVPSDGRPLIFLNDHPTIGGYPVVGVIDPIGLPGCAQARPGDGVRFHLAGSDPGYGAGP